MDSKYGTYHENPGSSLHQYNGIYGKETTWIDHEARSFNHWYQKRSEEEVSKVILTLEGEENDDNHTKRWLIRSSIQLMYILLFWFVVSFCTW